MSPKMDLATRLATVATCAAAILVPLAYLPGLDAPFLVPKFAALELTGALAFAAFSLRLTSGGGATPSRPVAWSAALVLVTTAASWGAAAHAPYAPDALARWLSLFGLAGGAVVVSGDRDARRTLLEAVTGAAAVTSLVGIWQHLELSDLGIPVISTPGSTFGNRNFAAEAVAMSLPFGVVAALGADRRGVRWALALALTSELVYLGASRARGGWAAAAAGLVTTLVLVRPRIPRAAAIGALAAAALATTIAVLPGRANPRHVGDAKRFASGVDVVESSFDLQTVAVRTRLGLWRRTLAMSARDPVLGVGPGNWPVVFPRYAEPGAKRDGVLALDLAPRQAHGDLLERTAEAGVVGLLALFGLAVAVIGSVRRRTRTADDARRTSIAAAAGSLAALACAGLTGFPLEMPGTLALGGLALGLAAGVTGEAPSDLVASRWPRAGRIGVVVACVALGFAGLRAERALRTSHWLGESARALRHDRGPDATARAIEALGHAHAASPDSFRVALRTGSVLLHARRFSAAARAARRALRIEPSSPNAWTLLAAAELEAGHVAWAAQSAERALAILHDNPVAAKVKARASRSSPGAGQPGVIGPASASSGEPSR